MVQDLDMTTSSETETAVNRAMALVIKGAIHESGKQPEDLVGPTGIPKTTIYNKFRKGKGFSAGEVRLIGDELGISGREFWDRAEALIAREGIDSPLFRD